jgi:hypothetical protein
MDHFGIVRRAWNITWTYRTLWLFGFLAALAGSGGNSSWRMPANSGSFPPSGPGGMPAIPWNLISGMASLLIALGCVIFLLVVIFTVLRYLGQTALIRMVDRLEGQGEKVSWRAGFRLGWSRAAGRIFLIDLVVGLGVFLLALLLLGMALAPLLLLTTQSEASRVLGVAASIGLGLLVFLLLLVIAIALGLLTPFFYRAAALDGLGVFAAIRSGMSMVRRRFTDVLLMGLILFGINLGVGLVMIPAVLAVLVVAGVAGGAPGFAVYALASQLTTESMAIALGALVGLPIFLIVLIIPLAFLSGVLETFNSSNWTLVYRELNRRPVLVFDQPGAPAPQEPLEA